MSAVGRNISFYLLMQDKEAKAIIESGDEEKFKELLFKWGCDTSEPYEIVSCAHRPIENDPLVFNGPMVKSVERQDPSWINSGNATFEAIVAARNDDSFTNEIKRMSKQTCDAAFRSKDAGAKAVREEKKKFKGEED